MATGIVAVSVLVLGGLGALGYRVLHAKEPTPAPPVAESSSAEPSPTTPSPSPSFDFTKLNSAETDPRPLTLREAFPDRRIALAGRAYRRVAWHLDRNCARAANGDLGAALKKAGCSRVLRATFVDGSKTYAVTTGIVVLPTDDARKKAVKAIDIGHGVWFRPLAARSGTGAEKIEESSGLGTRVEIGRYIVFALAAYSDGHNPSGADKRLTRLSTRMRSYASRPLAARAAQ